MNVIGLYGGVGSMMIPSKEFGFNIIGNIENRNCFNTGTFEENFNSKYYESIQDFKSKDKIDILFSHPKCSEFSTLNSSINKGKKLHEGFWNVVKGINIIKPKVFIIDNLLKSLDFYPLIWWADQLKDYDLTIELVSNYNYGNIQKNRNRLFIIGSLKKLKFVFIPNEKHHNLKLRHVLQNVENKYNHDLIPNNYKAPGFSPYTIGEMPSVLKQFKEGDTLYYYKSNNKIIYTPKKSKRVKQRIGTSILDTNKPSPTITSNLGFYLKNYSRPLTCRERARIQGCPDWFKFIFKGDYRFSQIMGDQTGKFIPIQFVRYFTEFVNVFLNGGKIESSNRRYLKEPTIINNRIEYCKKYGIIEEICDKCQSGNCFLRG